METITINNPVYESPVFLANIHATEPVVGNQGGTWSGKTFSIMQVIFFLTLTTRYENTEGRIEPIKSLVVGQDVPNLKKGAIADFEEVCDIIINSFPENCRHFFEYTYNITDKKAKFKINDSEIQFSSFQTKQSAKAGKRHYVFINEANGISYAIAEQLMFRAKIRTFVDYNPDAPFWFHHHFIGKKGVKMIYSNLTHNKFVPDKVKRELLAKGKVNPEFKKVYLLGKTGATEGIVFKNVKWVQQMPKTWKKESFGMDFGFTQDPSTLVRVVLHEGKIYAQCLLYEAGMSGFELANRLQSEGISKTHRIYCDNSKDTIDIIRLQGYKKATAARKGPGSIVSGIDIIKGYGTIHILDNIHWRAEQIGYKYKENKTTGKYLNEPEDNKGMDHIWDALRYAMQGIARAKKKGAKLRN